MVSAGKGGEKESELNGKKGSTAISHTANLNRAREGWLETEGFNFINGLTKNNTIPQLLRLDAGGNGNGDDHNKVGLELSSSVPQFSGTESKGIQIIDANRG